MSDLTPDNIPDWLKARASEAICPSCQTNEHLNAEIFEVRKTLITGKSILIKTMPIITCSNCKRFAEVMPFRC